MDGWVEVGDGCLELSEVLLGSAIYTWWSPSGSKAVGCDHPLLVVPP